jgi:SAM-dependent methyltransferase
LTSAPKVYSEIECCSACGSDSLELIYDFGECPLAGYFPEPGKAIDDNLISMMLMICNICELVQITPNVDDDFLFSNYRYISSVGMTEHFKSLVFWLMENNYIKKDSKILEIGSNDGTLLSQLKIHGFDALGVDPAANINEIAKSKGLNVVTGFFSMKTLDDLKLRNKFNVIISCNSFAHISNIQSVAQGISRALTEDGLFVVEVQSLAALVDKKAFDFIYHEHKFYYSIKSLNNLMKSVGLHTVGGCLINTHGGSMRLVFSKIKQETSIPFSNFLESEDQEKLTSKRIGLAISEFMSQVTTVRELLITEKIERGNVIGFGASGRGNMLLHYLKIDSLMEYVYDESELRIGRQMAFSNIRVARFSELVAESYNSCLVLAWNYSDSIIAKWPHKEKNLIIPFPEISTFTIK